MFNPLALFSTVKSGLITVGVIAGLSLFGMTWFQKVQAERAVVNLQIEKANLQAEVLKKQFELDGMKVTITILEQTYSDLAEALKTESQTEEDINNAPAEDDGPVAPVLRRTLDGVGRLLQHQRPD